MRADPMINWECSSHCFCRTAECMKPNWRLPLSSREVDRCSSGDTESSEFAEEAFDGVSDPDSQPVSAGITSLPDDGITCTQYSTFHITSFPALFKLFDLKG